MSDAVRDFHLDCNFDWKADQEEGIKKLKKYYECNQGYFDSFTHSPSECGVVKYVALFYYNGAVRFFTTCSSEDQVDLTFFKHFKRNFGKMSCFYYCPFITCE